jgi:PAS domain S-box-containing protein
MRRLLFGDRLLSQSKTPLRISLIYILVGGLWILCSDIILFTFFPSSDQFMGFEIFKGWFYILVTAGLLYMLIRRNIKTLLRSQETLKINEEKYRLLFEQANDAIVVLDEAGYHVEVNPQAETLTGYSRLELLAMRFTDLVPDTSPQQVEEKNWRFKETKHGQGEHLMRRKDGQPVYVEYAVTPGPPSYLQVILRDITARKQAELELRRQALIFKHLTDGVIVTDLERRIIDWNPAAERMSGYTKEEVLGKLPQIFLDQKKDPHLEQEIKAALISAGYWAGELKYLRKDGRSGVCETQIVLLLDDQGMPIARVSINHDITERKQLEEQFRQSQKMEAVGQLAGGVAHDFNNLLTVINGYVELLLRHCLEEAVDPEAMVKDLTHIQKAAGRGAALVRQLLIFSRKQVLQPTTLNLNDVVLTSEKMLHRVIGEDIEVTLHLAQELGQVKADRSQVEQIILNLALNSRDAMPEGGRLILETANIILNGYKAGASAVGSGPYVMLAVADTGMGMDLETQAHIFEPFFTTKESGKGTGLGLAMVHGIVKQSGGHISVHSELGQGTVFRIYLPRNDEPSEQPQLLPLARQEVGGSETILVVEDEGNLRDFLETVLTQYGYKTLTAADGNEALELCRQHCLAVDLLLTDVILPGGINGRALAEQLLQRCPRLKILFISGYTDDEILRQGVLKEKVAFLQKPFGVANLAEKVREVLNTPTEGDRIK